MEEQQVAVPEHDVRELELDTLAIDRERREAEGRRLPDLLGQLLLLPEILLLDELQCRGEIPLQLALWQARTDRRREAEAEHPVVAISFDLLQALGDSLRERESLALQQADDNGVIDRLDPPHIADPF